MSVGKFHKILLFCAYCITSKPCNYAHNYVILLPFLGDSLKPNYF